MWIYFWGFCSVPLLYLFILSTILYCIDYHRFIVSLNVRQCQSFEFILLSYCIGYSKSFTSPYKFQNQCVNNYKITCWDFDRDCIECVQIKLGRTDILTILTLLYITMEYLFIFQFFKNLSEFYSFPHMVDIFLDIILFLKI